MVRRGAALKSRSEMSLESRLFTFMRVAGLVVPTQAQCYSFLMGEEKFWPWALPKMITEFFWESFVIRGTMRVL